MKHTLDLTKLALLATIAGIFATAAHADDRTNYVTVKEITEMVPRTATLVHKWIGSGYFQTADGKGFFIGGERGGKDVGRYLRTLEEEITYAFPDAFLKYQGIQPATKP